MVVQAHPHDFSAVNGGYQCQSCSAFVPDVKMGITPAPAMSPGDGDGTIDYAWYVTMGNTT